MSLATIMTLSLALGGPPPGGDLGGGHVGPPSGDFVEIGGFTIDMSGIRQRPGAELPQDPLRPSDLAIGAIRSKLLQTSEGFQLVETMAGRQFLESPSWYLERDVQEGIILALRQERDDVVGLPQNELALKIASRQRLAQFGINRDEIGRTLQRKLMRADELEGDVSPPEVHRYKTFVMRGINGVEVEGHRAVITYHLDGSFQRAWIKWPPLAVDGHLLKTDLTDQAIAIQAFLALTEANEIDGDVTLRWKYMPTTQPDGSVALELVVVARLAAVDYEEMTEEPREINVPIGAF